MAIKHRNLNTNRIIIGRNFTEAEYDCEPSQPIINDQAKNQKADENTEINRELNDILLISLSETNKKIEEKSNDILINSTQDKDSSLNVK